MRSPWTWIILALALAGGVYLAARKLNGPSVPAARVVRRDLVRHVVASGRVLPPARVNLGSTLITVAREVLVKEGDRVRAGDLLVRLDDAMERASVAQAEAAVAQAEARLRQVRRVGLPVAREALRQAQVSVDQAEARHRRAQSLARSGASTAVDLEDAARDLDVARSRQQSAALQAAIASSTGGDQAFALSALAGARAVLDAARAQLARTRIDAPGGGQVLSRLVEPGDMVQPGRVLLVLALDGETRLVFQPEEKHLALIRVGQQARASADAYPDESFAALVDSIAPAVDPLRGTVEIKLRVPSPPPYLRADMTVSVDVEVARRPAALVIPVEALRDAASDRPWVMAIRDGRTEKRLVRLGARGDTTVEVVSGLSEGDAVVLGLAGGVSPGQRVRASSPSGEHVNAL